MTSLHSVLKESWTLVEERQEQLARYVFARLFLTHPESRELFPVAMDTPQAQLLSAVTHTIQLYDDAEALDFYLRALGREHRKYRLGERHLRTLGLALLDGVRTFGADGWCVAYDAAWADAVRLVTNTIRASALAERDSPPSRDAEVVSHLRMGSELAVLTVAPASPVSYLPGQHLPVETAYQPRVWREFAVANAPRPDGTLDLHVHAVDGGLVSSALVRRVTVGDRLRLAAPSGTMTLDRRSTRDIVCVAAGAGLAPMKALIEELTRYNRTRWVHLFFAGRTREDLYDIAALRRLAARYPWLSLVPVVSADPGFAGEHGTAAQMVERYGPWPDHDCFVAGPAADVRDTVQALYRLDVPTDRIRYSPFETLAEPLPAPRQPVPEQRSAPALPDEPMDEPLDESLAEGAPV